MTKKSKPAKAKTAKARTAKVRTIKAEAAKVQATKVRDASAPRTVSLSASFHDILRAGTSTAIREIDPGSTPGFGGDKKAGEAMLAKRAGLIGGLQERLFAESRGGGKRSALLVLQGMDTSGKGGIMRHVVGQADPQGIRHTAFKAPTQEEGEHDFLWRIRKALPLPGEIGVFDRSHYEDVLVVRVHELVPGDEWGTRYAVINAFERELDAAGTTVVKVMLHISKDEQRARLAERLDRPDKYWKYRPGDIDERQRWDDYMTAYDAVFAECSPITTPWHVVPADKKWYARLAVQELLLEALEQMDPQWPPADFDVAVEKTRLAES